MKILWVWLAILLAGCLPVTSRPGIIGPTQTLIPTATITLKAIPSPIWTVTPTLPAYCVVATGYRTGTVNLRSGPGMQYSVIDVVHEGDHLTITGQQINGWQQVKTPSRTGWFYTVKWCKK